MGENPKSNSFWTNRHVWQCESQHGGVQTKGASEALENKSSRARWWRMARRVRRLRSDPNVASHRRRTSEKRFCNFSKPYFYKMEISSTNDPRGSGRIKWANACTPLHPVSGTERVPDKCQQLSLFWQAWVPAQPPPTLAVWTWVNHLPSLSFQTRWLTSTLFCYWKDEARLHLMLPSNNKGECLFHTLLSYWWFNSEWNLRLDASTNS